MLRVLLKLPIAQQIKCITLEHSEDEYITDKRNMSSHPHTALFTLHSHRAPLSPPSLTPNDKRQKAENSCSNPQSLHLICTNAICLQASRGPRPQGDAHRKRSRQDPAHGRESAPGSGAGAEPRHRSVSSQPCPKDWDWTSLMLRSSSVWKQTIPHGHSRAATVLTETLPIYRAKQCDVFLLTLLGFSHTLQFSHPVLRLNQGLI